jgi:hypothetical protein
MLLHHVESAVARLDVVIRAEDLAALSKN